MLKIVEWEVAFSLHSRDFATRVTEINIQSDLIWMSSFAGPSYLTIRSSVCSNFSLRSLQLLIVTISSQLSTVTYASQQTL